MGGAVSAGDNNDELIDNLLDANYIKTQNVSLNLYVTFVKYLANLTNTL